MDENIKYLFKCTECGEEVVESDKNYHLKNNCPYCNHVLKFISNFSDEGNASTGVPRMHRGQGSLDSRILREKI